MEQQSSSVGGGSVANSQKWYPISGGLCANEGSPPENIALSDTAENCCKRFHPHFQDCVSLSTSLNEPTKQPTTKPTTQSMQQHSFSAPQWYPDYSADHCKNDGNHPKGVYLSATYNDCCDRFFMTGKEECYANSQTSLVSPATTNQPTQKPTSKPPTLSPSKQKEEIQPRWYPDYPADHCKNDGNQPRGVLLSASYKDCCDRFFMAGKVECYADSQVSLESPTTTNKPTQNPTSRPPTLIPSKQNQEMEQQSSPTGGTVENQYYPD
jgi:hypothetical protein